MSGQKTITNYAQKGSDYHQLLEYNEDASGSMSIKGKDNSPSFQCQMSLFLQRRPHMTIVTSGLQALQRASSLPAHNSDYPIDIFIAPWQASSSTQPEREIQNAKVGPTRLVWDIGVLW